MPVWAVRTGPGATGILDVPDKLEQITAANAVYPHRPVGADGAAWKEMIHRYFAGTLGLSILALAVLAWRRRREPGQPVALPLALLGVVVFQALLGMWTVTWQLETGGGQRHTCCGLTTLSLLAWLVLRQGHYGISDPLTVGDRALRGFAVLGLLLLVGQIALGGWTSANYAALACPDFPTCQAHWWPPLDFREAFTLWRGLGISYEGGVLGNDARVTIHVMHRLAPWRCCSISAGWSGGCWRHPGVATCGWSVWRSRFYSVSSSAFGVAMC
ncbi:MAG: COX15/CtaA family protein [Candidatus Competibacteraceae bacterium]